MDYKKWHDVMKDKMGRWRSTSLFFEEKRNEEKALRLPPIFTTKEKDHTVRGVTYVSLKKIYMNYDHVPGYEYDFATDVFGSWECWVNITKANSLRDHVDSWRKEYTVKLRAEALKRVITASKSDDPKGLQAAKYLADGDYEKVNKRGRPSKEEVERERKQQANSRETLNEDMERLGLSVINGGK